MWRPRTEAEIQAGIENGATVESASFDAKVALPQPGRNKDLAKDICAMTVDVRLLLLGRAHNGEAARAGASGRLCPGPRL